MDVLTLLKVLVRRWYVFIPVLVMSGAVSLLVLMSIKAEYEVTDTFEMLPPTAKGGNPFLGLSSSLNGIAEGVAKDMLVDSSVRALRAQGVRGTFSFDVPETDTTILLSAKGTDPRAVMRSEAIVARSFANEILAAQIRQGVPDKEIISVLLTSAPVAPNRLISGKVRAGAALGALGVAASLSSAVLFESYATHRERTRQGRNEVSTAPAAGGLGGSPIGLATHPATPSGWDDWHGTTTRRGLRRMDHRTLARADDAMSREASASDRGHLPEAPAEDIDSTSDGKGAAFGSVLPGSLASGGERQEMTGF